MEYRFLRVVSRWLLENCEVPMEWMEKASAALAGKRIAVVCRGGPVNGPFSAGALLKLKQLLGQLGLKISAMYGISAAAPTVAMSCIGMDEDTCRLWKQLRPEDIIDRRKGILGKLRALPNILLRDSIFSSEPLHKLLRKAMDVERVFSAEAIPVSVLAVDYLTGKPILFTNRTPGHCQSFIRGVMASLTLTPFMPPQIVLNAVDSGLILEAPEHLGDKLVLIDGGFSDNILLDQACRDGAEVVFIIDINGMQIGPLDSSDWHHWSELLQRAFHVLLTTNDGRSRFIVERMNELIDIRNKLAEFDEHLPPDIRPELDALLERLDSGLLHLSDKRVVTLYDIADRPRSIPFDFIEFTKRETQQLLLLGEQAAETAMMSLGGQRRASGEEAP